MIISWRSMPKYIYAKTEFEGLHSYPDAPLSVEFLRNEHRHIFHVKVYIEVRHNNRDVEFILFKRFLDNIIKELNKPLGSCEMISDQLYQKISRFYPGRKVIIDVSEDNENGSYIEYE